MSAVFEHLDEVVERLARAREELLADEGAPARATQLAVVFAAEAEAWSQLYELSTLRLVWRAALAAEAGARTNAALWAARAGTRCAPALPVPSRVVGRVGAPRPTTLSSPMGAVGGGR